MTSRRDFITVIGSAAAVAWPMAARAQHGERVRRIAIMMQIAERDPETQARLAVLRRALGDIGWIDGLNIRIDYQAGTGNLDQVRLRVAQLVASEPDVIVAASFVIVQEVQRQTKTIPILFVNLGEPVELGIVSSLARPGGNTTGFMGSEPSLGSKWLWLLKEIAPDVTHVLALINPDNRSNQATLSVIKDAASAFAVRVSSVLVRDEAEIVGAVNAAVREPGIGLIAMPGGPTTAHRKTTIAMASQNRLPAIYAFRYYVNEGGLMAYGTDVLDEWRRSAGYVDRILRGESPSELPVQGPVKFELVINLKTAKTLSLTIPPTLLAIADEVIE